MTTKNPQNKRATIKDVAKLIDTSSATVSMALRGDPRISEETRLKVETAARKVGYVYNRSAANLRKQCSDIVGLVIGDIANPFFAQLAAGVNDILIDAGKILFLASYEEEVERQNSLLKRLSEQHVDGILLCPAWGSDPSVTSNLKQWNIPCVQILRSPPNSPFDYVSTDYRSGINQICEHLIALGHREIVFVGGDKAHSATLERHRGFTETLERHGLNSNRIFRIEPSRHNGRELVADLLTKHPEVTAAICFNDVTAFGVMAGLRRAGREPGRDFAVTGFDNVEEAADRKPALTTVDSRAHEMGRRAAAMLLKRIEARERPRQQLILPAELIVRESCGTGCAEPVRTIPVSDAQLVDI